MRKRGQEKVEENPDELVAFLPWERNQKVTPCPDASYPSVSGVAKALATENPGKAVHVVQRRHLRLDPSERPVVWDCICAPPAEGPAEKVPSARRTPQKRAPQKKSPQKKSPKKSKK